MSQTAVLVALCQVSIALGILYLGLPVSRYREKIYDNLITILGAQNYGRLADGTSGCFSDLLRKDKKFADCHHFILEWIRELPAQFQIELRGIEKWGIPSDPVEAADSARSDLLSKHRLFQRNIDRSLIWILTIMLALVVMWGACFSSLFLSYLESQWWLLLIVQGLILSGQLAPVCLVWQGRKMVEKITEEVRKSVEYIVTAHQLEAAKASSA